MNDQRRVFYPPAARRGPSLALGRILIAAPLLGWAFDTPVARAQTPVAPTSTTPARPSGAPAVILNPQKAQAEARHRAIPPAAILNAPRPTATPAAPRPHPHPPAVVFNPAGARTPAPRRASGTRVAATPAPALSRPAAPAPAPRVAQGTTARAPKTPVRPTRSSVDRAVKPTAAEAARGLAPPSLSTPRMAQAPAARNESKPNVADELQPPDAPLPPVSDPKIPAVTVEPATPVIPSTSAYPIDLYVALRLADNENPEIAAARAAILEALANQLQARVLLVPTLNAGLHYHGHTGNLIRSAGRILSLSEQSLYIGGGSDTVAAETVKVPMVNLYSPITEAWFEPLITHQRVIESEAHAVATANEILREVSTHYLELLGAEARLEAMRISQAQTVELTRVISSYAVAGERREADAFRAGVTSQLRLAEVQKLEGEVAVASARLAQRLNLDPSVRLLAHLGPLTPITLIDPASDPETLTLTALQRRPELVARSAEIAAVTYEFKEELARPLLPTIWLGFSAGAFGGGSNLSQPLLGRFSGRTDFDVRLLWTVLNLGDGNMARWRRRRAEIGIAVGEQSLMANQVRREVASALATMKARLNQIQVARIQLSAAESGFNEDFDRARQNLGRPIEALDNLEHLVDARIRLIEAITQYNQAQFALFVALGSPPPLPPPPTEPVAPPPVTVPLHGPIAADG